MENCRKELMKRAGVLDIMGEDKGSKTVGKYKCVGVQSKA
jgi:hypothetical protein